MIITLIVTSSVPIVFWQDFATCLGLCSNGQHSAYHYGEQTCFSARRTCQAWRHVERLTHMHEHHQHIIARLVDRFAGDPLYPAVIIGGSVAKGRARPDSDVDIMLITTDEEWARRQASGDLWYASLETIGDTQVFVDGKIYGLAFLQEVAAHGSEPARAAFDSAFPAYCRIPQLEALIGRILTYPESDRDSKMRSFYSQVALLGRFFVGEAAKRDDRYLMSHAVSDLVLFGCRLVLAYNRILYPYHKWLMWEVERAPEKPEGFMQLIQDVLARPGVDTAEAFCRGLDEWHEWGVSLDQAVGSFIVDSEWNWRFGVAPVYDR
ncbi:MAG TPA: nucleotidyltransferase domain-containing protein [Armatimonadota bacterium]|jgi:hypothetical protein